MTPPRHRVSFIHPARHTLSTRSSALALAALLIVVSVRCSDGIPTAPVEPTPLPETIWRLVSLEPGAPAVLEPLPGRFPGIGFGRGATPPPRHVGGHGPCNGFGGEYAATSMGTIAIDSLGATRGGCPGVLGDLENAYFDRLDAARTWSIWADSLRLETDDGRWVLFVRDELPPELQPPGP